MDVLSIQVHPDLLASFNEQAVEQLRNLSPGVGLVHGVDVQHGEDNGRYININFKTSSPRTLWPVVRAQLVRFGLQRACIVTCTGSKGWDNYLLLHHFNPEEPLENFSAL